MLQIKGSVLEKKVLQPWQEELFGIVRDPTYTFMATTGKLANVNFTVDYLNRIAKQGGGTNGFVKSELQIANDLLNKRELKGVGSEEDILKLRERLMESDDGALKIQQAELTILGRSDPLIHAHITFITKSFFWQLLEPR